MGLALYHNELLDVHFTNSFYKHILGLKIQLEDMQSIDPDFYRNLQYLLDNDIEGREGFLGSLKNRFGVGFGVFESVGCVWKDRDCGVEEG
jgi:hypothetical protein